MRGRGQTFSTQSALSSDLARLRRNQRRSRRRTFWVTEATELRHGEHRRMRHLLFGGSSWERWRPRRLTFARARDIGKSCTKNMILTDSISKDLNHEWTRIRTNTGALGPFRIRADSHRLAVSEGSILQPQMHTDEHRSEPIGISVHKCPLVVSQLLEVWTTELGHGEHGAYRL
jgi:hypothetical protein